MRKCERCEKKWYGTNKCPECKTLNPGTCQACGQETVSELILIGRKEEVPDALMEYRGLAICKICASKAIGRMSVQITRERRINNPEKICSLAEQLRAKKERMSEALKRTIRKKLRKVRRERAMGERGLAIDVRGISEIRNKITNLEKGMARVDEAKDVLEINRLNLKGK